MLIDFRAGIEAGLRDFEAGRWAQAERRFREALARSPRDDQLLHLVGACLVKQLRHEEAVEPVQKAISLNRRNPEYHNTLGCALRGLGRFEAALDSLGRALKAAPEFADARFNFARTLAFAGRWQEAKAEFAAGLRRHPGDVELHRGLATVHWNLGEFDDAVAALREAMARIPASGDVRYMLGEYLLALGRFEEGWFHYLWRVNRHGWLRRLGLPFNDPALMRKLAGPFDGTVVKVHAEQGIGDDLFFLRFLPILKARGARVLAAVTSRLVGMVQRSGIADAVEPTDERVPPDGGWKMLGDLPHLLDAWREPVPASLRFPALPARLEEMRTRIASWPRPLIGLAWRAGTAPEADNENMLFKQAPFDEFAAMAATLPGTLVVLQRAPREGEVAALEAVAPGRVRDLTGLNADLEGMLALLDLLDDCVCVSNTNVHLLAGLGRPARVLVSNGCEFRWLAAGDESPWFPGCRVYRQEAGRWGIPLQRVAMDLRR